MRDLNDWSRLIAMLHAWRRSLDPSAATNQDAVQPHSEKKKTVNKRIKIINMVGKALVDHVRESPGEELNCNEMCVKYGRAVRVYSKSGFMVVFSSPAWGAGHLRQDLVIVCPWIDENVLALDWVIRFGMGLT